MAVGKGKGRTSGRGRKAALCAARGGDALRISLYEEVTAKIVAQLEAGVFPWAQPWSSAAAVPGLPRNAISGRPYSGINVLILWGAVAGGAFPSQDWLTFKQALAAGGCVRKGERGQTIFYADRFTPDEGHEQAGSADGGGAEGEKRSIPFLKRFTVFNAAQCDGLPPRLCGKIVRTAISRSLQAKGVILPALRPQSRARRISPCPAYRLVKATTPKRSKSR